jgi:hypothetical protein
MNIGFEDGSPRALSSLTWRIGGIVLLLIDAPGARLHIPFSGSMGICIPIDRVRDFYRKKTRLTIWMMTTMWTQPCREICGMPCRSMTPAPHVSIRDVTCLGVYFLATARRLHGACIRVRSC